MINKTIFILDTGYLFIGILELINQLIFLIINIIICLKTINII